MAEILDTGCCKRFKPELWDEKVIKWENKPFIREKVRTFFYIPINFGSVMKKLNRLAGDNKLDPESFITLSRQNSMWSMEVLEGVDYVIPGADNIHLSGEFICKVFEGQYNQMGEWYKEFNGYTKNKGYKVTDIYNWYTTCPKCSKIYGENYVVFIGQIRR